MRSLRIGVFIASMALAASTGSALAVADESPCCGPIAPAANVLTSVLDGTNVESLWLARLHVNWETGEPDRAADYEGSSRATHCSAFAAAVGKRLGVYLLRPPEHGLVLLASAQARWFASPEGRLQGWRALASAQDAQEAANRGELTVIVYESPDPKRPGHIVIVRPSLKSAQRLEQEGPEIIQAGTHNHLDWTAAQAFAGHRGAWPLGVRYFSHDVQSP